MERNFCYLCGGKLLTQTEDSGSWLCEACGNRTYSNPKPAVDAALFNDADEILITVRGREPRKGLLDMPGGFMRIDERVEECIERELDEELGMRPEDHDEFVYVDSLAVEYPTDHETEKLIVITVAARVNRTDFVASDDIASYSWMKVSDLKPENISQGQIQLNAILKAAALFGITS